MNSSDYEFVLSIYWVWKAGKHSHFISMIYIYAVPSVQPTMLCLFALWFYTNEEYQSLSPLGPCSCGGLMHSPCFVRFLTSGDRRVPTFSLYAKLLAAIMTDSASPLCIPIPERRSRIWQRSQQRWAPTVIAAACSVRSNKPSFDDQRGRRSILAPTRFSSQLVSL